MINWHKNKKKKFNGGQTAIITVLMFIAISLAVLSSAVVPTANQISDTNNFLRARQGYAAADSVNDEAYYRLNQGRTLPATLSLPFSQGETGTAQVTTTGAGTQISTTGISAGTTRYAQSVFAESAGASFNYGLQVGNGGISISGGSTINGSVYSNGDILSDGGGNSITGSATAANQSNPVANQSVGYTDGTTPLSVSFGNTSTTQDSAQSFKMSTTTAVTAIRLYLKKVGSPSNVTVRITNDSSGKPGSTLYTSGTLSASTVTTSFGYVTIPFSTTPSLNTSSTYWIVLDYTTQSSTNYYVSAATNSTYANGLAKTGTYSTSGGSNVWNNASPSGADLYFDVFVGGNTSIISGSDSNSRLSIGSGGTGTAWADEVDNVSVAGTAYCQVGAGLYNQSNVTKLCDVSRADPTPLAYPISDANITEWKDSVTSAVSAISGGWTYSGNLTINYAGTTTSTLKRVSGNLSLNCSSASATFGDLYVTGNLSVSSGCVFNASTLHVGGDMTVGSGVATVSTTKVDGHLYVSSGSRLKMKGIIWSVDDVSLSGGGYISLDSSIGSGDGLIITDDKISTSGGSYFTGSGTSGSYIVAISTNTSSSAVSISGGSGSVVIFAPYGTADLSGGASAKSIVANKLVISGGSTVTYDSGLTNLDFTNGPSGSWAVTSWGETSQ